MKHNDSYLTKLSDQIASLKDEYENAKAVTTDRKKNVESIRYWVGYYKSDIAEMRDLANGKFDEAKMEYEYGSKECAALLSEEGHEINRHIEDTREDLNETYDSLNYAKEEFEQALSNQKALKEQLNLLKSLHKNHLQRLNEKDASMWREKTCKNCGGIFKYRTDWEHQPNYCKNCKENFNKSKNN